MAPLANFPPPISETVPLNTALAAIFPALPNDEHLAEIKEMQGLLEANDPKMTTMIESYRRGFLKGIAATSVDFISNNK